MFFSPAKKANGSSNREAKGFLVLIIVICLPFIVQYSYRFLFDNKNTSNTEVYYLQEECKPVYAKSSQSGYDKKRVSFPSRIKQIKPVNINTADSLELEKLPGIGFKLAARIIRYRSLLGRYVKVEQLKEVYGISEETFGMIQTVCMVSDIKVKMISGDSLWAYPYKVYHPYLSKDIKAALVKVNRKEVYSKESLTAIIKAYNEKLLWYIHL